MDVMCLGGVSLLLQRKCFRLKYASTGRNNFFPALFLRDKSVMRNRLFNIGSW